MTVDWKNKIIDIPKTDLTLVTGTLYELDTEWFKDEIRALESDVYGMPNIRIIDHNTSYTVAGTTYARKVEVVNGYRVKFEDGQYSVRLVGSNNNLFDVENGVLFQNQVQVIATNSAGLIVKTVIAGSGVTEQDKEDIADLSRIKMDTESTKLTDIKNKTDNLPDDPATETSLASVSGSVSDINDIVSIIRKLTANRIVRIGDILRIYQDDGVTIWKEYNVSGYGREEI
jgi:hypothetical protein